MKQLSHLLSKAEEKKLVICRERILDGRLRVEEISDILSKRGWQQAGIIAESVQALRQLEERLEGIESEIYRLKTDNG